MSMHFQQDSISSRNNDPKKREYLKQQHQLRTMTKTTVPLSADNMIETLLSKKEIFQKKTVVADGGQQIQVGAWPPWLTPGREPQLYKDVWNKVALPNGFSDTTKLSLLLMTSRLTTDTLGYIWSLSNITVPGCLTQQELYVALALVALAQRGYTFVNSGVVRQLKEAPIPVLDVNNFDSVPNFQMKPQTAVSSQSAMATPSTMPPSSTVTQGTTNSSLIPSEQLPSLSQTIPTITENISLLGVSQKPLSLIDSSPTKTLAVLSATDLKKDYSEVEPVETNLEFSDFQTVVDDDFDDFKSADIFSSDMNSLTVLDVPQNVNESSEGTKELDVLFPRCLVKPKTPDLELPPASSMTNNESIEDWILMDMTNCTKIKADEPSPVPKTSGSFNLMEDISSTFSFDLNKPSEPPSKLSLNVRTTSETSTNDLKVEDVPHEPLSLDLHPIKASSFPSPEPNLSSGKSETIEKEPSLLLLPNSTASQEDKYSALRLLDAGLSPESDTANRATDDFGDFLTADVSTTVQSKTLNDADDDIQVKCLQACLKQLREAVTIFENIDDTKVLDEVANNEKGKAYLQEILEVERIGRRIRSTREPCDLILEFESLSKTLQPYIEFVKNNHLEEKNGPKCGICLCEHGPAHVKYGINNFHAPCANLYLHLVDPILPIAPVM